MNLVFVGVCRVNIKIFKLLNKYAKEKKNSKHYVELGVEKKTSCHEKSNQTNGSIQKKKKRSVYLNIKKTDPSKKI